MYGNAAGCGNVLLGHWYQGHEVTPLLGVFTGKTGNNPMYRDDPQVDLAKTLV